ncbi:MAG: inositol 2-dehydrogenase [Oceanospirillaceae bacterium]|nr:inositol 2-dehydrogenase [Oceanospirillaceae bacterium]
MLKTALIGAGRIGQVHAANIASNPHSELSAITDIFIDSANKLADKYQSKVRTLEEILTDKSIQAVVIASATDTHSDLIERAATAGKAIFCEKPIDLDSERVMRCLKIVKECNAKLMIGFNRRFDPDFAALQKRYLSGELGAAEVLQITSRDPSPPPVEYIKVSGGLFRDMSIHDLDMARFILNEDPVAVSASASCIVESVIGDCGDVDTALITLEFPSGALVSISNSRRTTYGYDQRIELHAAKGMLQVDNVRENNMIETTNAGVNSAKAEYFFLERYMPAYAAEWDHFTQAVLNNTVFSCTAEDGAKALVMAELAHKALITGQKQFFDWDSLR